jgi:hypothetical protein
MTDQRKAEIIESKIDKSITGGLAVEGFGGALTMQPRNMTELMEFSKMMALGGVALRPTFRGNPGACLAVSMQALRWGMDPFAVANKAYEVNNQLAYESQLVHAVVNTRAPLQARLKLSYDGQAGTRTCTISGLLRGEDQPATYTSPQVKDITPKNSPLWKTDPDQQLFYFSVRSWARRHVPEVLLGVYTDDELQAQHQGAERAKDVTPRPTRDDYAQDEDEVEAEPEQQAEAEVVEQERAADDGPTEAAEDKIKAIQAEAVQALTNSNEVGMDAVLDLYVNILTEAGASEATLTEIKQWAAYQKLMPGKE